MEDLKKEYIDMDYIIMRDKIILYLLNYKINYSLCDIKKIRKELKILLKLLEKGKIENEL